MPTDPDLTRKVDLLLHHARVVLFLSAVNLFMNFAMIGAAFLIAAL